MARILLVYDVDGWAWHRRCLALIKHAPAEHAVTAIKQRDYRPHMAYEHDCLLWFDWANPPSRIPARCWSFVASEGPIHRHGEDAGPHDLRRQLADPHTDAQAAGRIMHRYCGMIVINPRAVEFVRSLNRHTVHLLPGVDLEQFAHRARTAHGRKLRVGWCGKPPQGSRWTPKGYREVFQPLVRQLGERFDFEANVSTSENARSAESMARWYQSLDVFLVTSCAEGTPSVLLEAAACGCPLVSTDVGIANMLVESRFLLSGWHDARMAERVVGEAAAALGYLDAHREQWPAISGQMPWRVRAFDWRELAQVWLDTIAGVKA